MNIKILIQNTTTFIVFALLQIIIFNNIEITSVGVIPAFFLLYVLLLPYETPDWVLISSSFLIGLLIDIFADTMGLNAASTVFVAFIRPTLLKSLAPRGGYEASTYPRIYYMGIGWFMKYAAIMIFIQQLTYYILSDYSIALWLPTILKIFIGSIISILLIIISQYVIYRK